MNRILKDIDVICVFYRDRQPVPRKFRITYDRGDVQTVTVDQISLVEHETPMGLHKIIYHCMSEVDGVIVRYEIMYLVREMQWKLCRRVDG